MGADTKGKAKGQEKDSPAVHITGIYEDLKASREDLEATGVDDPYVNDAKSFLTQSMVCVNKYAVANGMGSLEPLPAPPPDPEPEIEEG